MMTQILQGHPSSSKATLDEAKEPEEGFKELEDTSDEEVYDKHSTPGRTQMTPFCATILFIYGLYIFFVAAFIVASAMFIKTEDTRPGAMLINDTNS
ncbi:hypothetical protein ECG_04210 [Echinococcus granulosus]|uniref:Expressed conserved protein n=1 Tax=Echinococcus granulosus TaxID=6210 RepID=A0A068WIR1_ECHGR|nr:hypothetical protein ECG_04210 [Echinococcus granulosus]CDS17509.1 hypothetical protein EgrG_001026600 [Echinococcus granulosus]